MKKNKCTSKNVVQVLRNLADYLEADKQSQEIIAPQLEDFLNNLYEDDFFGTEGQCDPRGDQRN